MASFLPATLDERTVPDLVEDLDRAFYPPPSSGFTVRMLIIEGLTLLCIILVVFYLWLHYQSSTEKPKHRCLWVMRFVDRPSGRFLLINPRPAWSYTILFYTSFNIAFLAICWAVYARGIDQRTWIALRAFNPLVLFLAGWSFTFANLQAFFVTIESERVFVSARTANTLFLGGGAFIIIVELAVAIDATVFAELLWDRYLELRGCLVALDAALEGRVPTLVDFILIAAPGEAFAAAAAAARIHTIVQFSVVSIMPTAIIVTNLGGLALARRLRRRLEESDNSIPDPLKPVLPVSSALERGEASEHLHIVGEELQLGPRAATYPARGPSAPEKVDSTTARLALRRSHSRAPATRAQARAKLTLQSAANDLMATSLSTAFMAVSLVGIAIWFACASATGALSSGKWVFVEGTVLPAQWLYTAAILAANVYMISNACRSRRQLTDLATTAAPSDERQGIKSAGAASEEASSQAETRAKSEAGSAAADYDGRPFFSREPLLLSERPALLRRVSSRSLWSPSSSEGIVGESHGWRTRPGPPALPSYGGGAIMVTVETVVVSCGVDEEDEEEGGWQEADDDVARLRASLERRGG